jgi:hypothetical protein
MHHSYCTTTQTSCTCTNDSQVGNNVTCGAFNCCFLGVAASGNYQDCDCDTNWDMNCDGYIGTLMMGGTYSSVMRVQACPQ